MKKRECVVCGKSLWARSRPTGPTTFCKACRRKSGQSDPSQLIGKLHPRRIKKVRTPKPKDTKKKKRGDE